MIYYSSDLHFNHVNIIKSCDRPFSDIYDMNNKLMLNWNNTLTDEDDIYFLGDFSYSKNNKQAREVIELIKNLKGRKHLVLGNHDTILMNFEEFKELFESIDVYKKISDEGNYVVLMHYPLETWERSHYGSYHLHGHIHANEINYIPNRFNVGLDVNNYKPVTLTELIDRDNDLKFVTDLRKDEIDLITDKLELFGFKYDLREPSKVDDCDESKDMIGLYVDNNYVKEVMWFIKGFFW